MLAQTLRRFTFIHGPAKHLPIRLSSTVHEPQTAPDVASCDIHNINVTGKVQNVFTFKNGTVTMYIKSQCPRNFSKIHKVCVTNGNAALLDMVKSKVAVDQKVHIEGKLNTSKFQTHDGKNRSTSAIMATNIHIFSDVETASEEFVDENSVELAGKITTEITGNDFKTFTLGTLKAPKLNRSYASNVCFNRIFVYDKSLFPILSDVQIKKDEFLVRGEINYRIEKSDTGKKETSSYITASHIFRL